jgi:Fe-S cluster biogenesis protein NfuA
MEKTNEQVLEEAKKLLQSRVKPYVDSHGGAVEALNFDKGVLTIQLQGACSGCAGSTMTLKYGIENMLKHYIPEIQNVVGEHDPNSTVDPYYPQ